jgi:hypothetical protein
MFWGLLAYRTFKQVHYMYICTYSEASTAAGYGWNMSCGRVEWKEEHGGTEGGIWNRFGSQWGSGMDIWKRNVE